VIAHVVFEWCAVSNFISYLTPACVMQVAWVPTPPDSRGPAGDPLPVPITTYSLLAPINQSLLVVNTSTPPPAPLPSPPPHPAPDASPPLQLNPPPPPLIGQRASSQPPPPAPLPAGNTDTYSSSTSAGLVAGTVVGGLVGGVLVGVGAAWLLKHARSLNTTTSGPGQQEGGGKYGAGDVEDGTSDGIRPGTDTSSIPPDSLVSSPTTVEPSSTGTPSESNSLRPVSAGTGSASTAQMHW
jgi:hypothetical protein